MNEKQEFYSLFYKEKKGERKTIYTKQQPTFFDVMQLVKCIDIDSFEEIPLTKDSILTFNFVENNMYKPINCTFIFPKSIIMKEQGVHCCEEHASHYLSCFLFKKGDIVMYLQKRPSRGILKKEIEDATAPKAN